MFQGFARSLSYNLSFGHSKESYEISVRSQHTPADKIYVRCQHNPGIPADKNEGLFNFNEYA